MVSDCIVGCEPRKSELDDREYRTLTLSNGLKVLLVHDAQQDKAAAALDVSVGYFNDPENLPGLAHFLEHMLFLGTAKYPDEDSYSAYLAEKGGDSNAYTSNENTNYQFQLVVPKAARAADAGGDAAVESPLYEALDRFSQFFIAPLFTEAATSRELNAVDSEHQKNVQNDGQRLWQLSQSCASRDHPYSKFGTGSKATLWDEPQASGVDTREALLAFHKKYYSANLMHLCISSPHSLDVMQSWAVELFSAIPNASIPVPSAEYASVAPLTDVEMRRIFHVVPIKDHRILTLSWLVPPMKKLFRSKPEHYISHLLGHEGKGSLLSLLKEHGWVDNLFAGPTVSVDGFGFFDVSIYLTKVGVDHVDDIVGLVFGYIKLILERGIELWIHEESAALSEMSFRFAERVEPFNLVQHLSSNMSQYPEKDYLCGGYICSEYDPELIKKFLLCLTPDRLNLTVVGKFVEGTTDAAEKWYGTEYRCEKIAESKLKAWNDATTDAALSIPEKNAFIATDFSLVAKPLPPGEVDDSGPEKIIDNDKFEVHYKLDRTFQRPKVETRIVFGTPTAYASPRNYVLCSMFVGLLMDELNEYSYDAELAGLSYNLVTMDYGVSLILEGYNHRLQALMDVILERMASFKCNPERFAMIFDQLERRFANFNMDQPYKHAMYALSYLLESPKWHISQYLTCMRTPGEITVESVDAFLPQLLSRMRTTIIVHGNVTEEWTRSVCESVEKALPFAALPKSERQYRRIVQLPTDCSVVNRLKGPNPDDRNSAVQISFQVGVLGDFAQDVTLELLGEILNKPAFHELRTVQQLGYMVFTGVDTSENVRGLFFLIQSTVEDPDELCRRIEAFLVQFRKESLESLSEAEFDGFVNSMIAKKLEKDKKMRQRTHRFNREILGQTFAYDRAQSEVAELRKVRRADVVALFDKFIAAKSPMRRKACSLVYASEHGMCDSMEAAASAAVEPNGVPVRIVSDPIAFRLSQPLYPAPGTHTSFVVES